MAAADCDQEFNIHQHNEADFNILKAPWQDVHPTLRGMGIRARQRHAATTRRALNGTHEIDAHATRKAMEKQAGEDIRIIRSIATLGRWDEQLANESGTTESDACELCGGKGGGWEHLVKRCPETEAIRK